MARRFTTYEELVLFVGLVGLGDIEKDNDGQLIIYTGLKRDPKNDASLVTVDDAPSVQNVDALTVEKLAKILEDEFERDEWGDIDPHLLWAVQQPRVADEESDDDVEGMRRALERVIKVLKGENVVVDDMPGKKR